MFYSHSASELCSFIYQSLWKRPVGDQGWGTPLDGADGEVAKFLESKGAKRSAGGQQCIDAC